MNGLMPIFEMNLPEGALLERLRMQFAKIIPNFDSLDLLAVVGQSQIGRLRYAATGGVPAAVPEQSLADLLTYAGAEDLFADLLRLYAQHSGVSGVQPKVLVRAQGLPSRLSHRPATHIVKSFDPREYPELAANEFVRKKSQESQDFANGLPWLVRGQKEIGNDQRPGVNGFAVGRSCGVTLLVQRHTGHARSAPESN
jgi:serine/threonine protein kinase HipA of HipAB toxin-antitoxin module